MDYGKWANRSSSKSIGNKRKVPFIVFSEVTQFGMTESNPVSNKRKIIPQIIMISKLLAEKYLKLYIRKNC